MAVTQNVDQKTVVDGILYCANGQSPTLEECERYLGFNYETDEPFSWVIHEFMNEALPSDYYQYISNGRVVW